jgi:hypothetical protein
MEMINFDKVDGASWSKTVCPNSAFIVKVESSYHVHYQSIDSKSGMFPVKLSKLSGWTRTRN